MENKRQPAKPKASAIDWSVTNKSRKRGPNKINSPNSVTRIQQLYNSHNSKPNATPLSQRKPVIGLATSQASAKSASVPNRRRKSELLSPIARSTETESAVVHSTEHIIRDNEYQLQEEEVNSVPLHSHHYKINTTLNDTSVQLVTATQPPLQMQQNIDHPVPNSNTTLTRIGPVRPNQTQIIFQPQMSTPKLIKAPPTSVAAPNSMPKKSNQLNGPSQMASQFVSNKGGHIISSTTTVTPTTTAQRIPPKINILSQQTITKSNINFVPLADNKIIIKSDSKLANAFKSHKIQMIPGQTSSSLSPSSIGSHKMQTQNNLMIRGTTQHTMHHAKVISLPLNSNQNAQAFVVNMPTAQSPIANASIPAHAMHTIEKVITTDDTPIDINSADTDDYIIEDTTGITYELIEQNIDDTAAYVTTTTKIEPTPTKRAKFSNYDNNSRSHEYRQQRMSFVTPKSLTNATQQFNTNVANNELVSTIIYEEHPATSTDWEYELNYSGKPNGNGQSTVTTGNVADVVIDDDATEYQDSNIIYTEEEIIEDESMLQEEYVTTEVFSPNGNYHPNYFDRIFVI